MLTPNETAALRALLAREAEAASVEYSELAPGDIAQIRPFAEPTFAGMPVQITATEPHQVRGFLLRPHRGGCRESWLSLKHCQLERVGRTWWPDPEFARRCEWYAPTCKVQR
jgi:hypothetical protein